MKQGEIDGILYADDFCTIHLHIQRLYSTENDHHITSENMTEDEKTIARNYYLDEPIMSLRNVSPHNPELKQVYEGIITYRLAVAPQILQVIEPDMLEYLVPFDGDYSNVEHMFAEVVLKIKTNATPDDLDGISWWSDELKRRDPRLITEEYQLAD